MKRKPRAPAKKRRTRPLPSKATRKKAFLTAFKLTASLTDAARAVGISRGQHFEWIKKDAKYVLAFEEARLEADQTLYDSAVQRALVGLYEPLVYQGNFCYAQRNRTLCELPDGREVFEEDLPTPIADCDVRNRRTVSESYGAPLGVYKRSEMLHLALLRARIPAFRAANVELTGAGGGAIASTLTVEFVRPKEKTD